MPAMTTSSTNTVATATHSRSVARLSSDEFDVLQKLGEDRVTLNLDITLKPVTWIALQKYALKQECTLAESVENGLEESAEVADCLHLQLGGDTF
jgi:macrodomain Ter protein organizer (MatP/YcbG family)